MAKNPFNSSRGLYGSDSDVLEQFLLLQNPQALKQNLENAKKTLSDFYSKEIKSALEKQVEELKKEIRNEFKGKSDGLSKDVKDKVKKDADEVANIYGDAQKSVAEEASKEIEGDAGGGGGTKGIQWSKIGKNIGSSLASNAIQMLTQGFKQWSESTYGKLDIMGSMGKGNSLFAQIRSEMGNLTWSQNSLRDYSKTVQASFKQLQEDGVIVSPSTIYGMYERLGDLVSLTGSSGARLTSLLNTVTKIQESSGVLDVTSSGSQTLINALGENLGGQTLEIVNGLEQLIAGNNPKWTNAIGQTIVNDPTLRKAILEARTSGMSDEELSKYTIQLIEDRLQASSYLTGKIDAQATQEIYNQTSSIIDSALSDWAGFYHNNGTLAAFIANGLGYNNAGEILDLDERLVHERMPQIMEAILVGLHDQAPQMAQTLGTTSEMIMYANMFNPATDSAAFEKAVSESMNYSNSDKIYEGISHQNSMVDQLNFQLEEIGLQMSTDTYDNQVLGWLTVISSQIADFVGTDTMGSVIQGIAQGGAQTGAIAGILGAGAGGEGGMLSGILSALGGGGGAAAASATGIGAVVVAIASILTAWQASEKATDENIANMVGDLANPDDDLYAHKVWDPTTGKWLLTYDENENANEAQDIADVNWENKNWFEKMGTGISNFFTTGFTDENDDFWVRNSEGWVDMDLSYAKYAQKFREESAASPHLQKMYSLYKALGLIDSNKTEGEALREFKDKYDSGDLDRLYKEGKVFKFGDNWGEYDLAAMNSSGQYDAYLAGLARGLDNIPYDGYPAILHEGEMVIPARRANWLRVAMGGKPVNYSNVPANKLTGTNSFVQSIPEYNSSMGDAPVFAAGDDAVGFAKRHLGDPYDRDRRNNINPYYFDCSSLVSRAYGGLGEQGSAGVISGTPTAGGIGESWPGKGFSIIYSANQNGGHLLSKQDVGALGLLPGDILLYRLNGGRAGRYQGISHAAMFYGGNQQIHTYNKEVGLTIGNLWDDVAMILRYGDGGGTGVSIGATSALPTTSTSAPRAALPASLARLAGSRNPMVQAMLKRLGYTDTDIASASGTSMTDAISTGTVSSLASFRSNLYNSALPEHQLHMFNRTRKEVGGQGDQAMQAWLETIFNRAMSRGKTLEGVVTGNYYPSQNGLNDALNPTLQSRISAALALVLGGSNITSFATGNASGNVGFGYGKGKNDPYTLMINGERFGIESNDKKWADSMKQQYAMYAGGVVKRTPGGVSAIIGEGAYDEAVVPLRQDKDYLGIEEMSLNIVEALDIISEKICKKLDTIISLKQQAMSNNDGSELSTMQKSARTMALINFKGEY